MHTLTDGLRWCRWILLTICSLASLHGHTSMSVCGANGEIVCKDSTEGYSYTYISEESIENRILTLEKIYLDGY